MSTSPICDACQVGLNISLAEFDDLIAQGYSHIPLCRAVMADLDTPLSVYLKLANAPYSYLFESVQGGEKWGRYSIIGLPCTSRLEVRANSLKMINGDKSTTQPIADPLAYIEQYRQQFKVPSIRDLPRFAGGLVGFLGYESSKYMEQRLAKLPPKPDPIGAPDILLLLSRELVVFDNLAGKMIVIVHAQKGEYASAQARLDALCAKLQTPLVAPAPKAAPAQAAYITHSSTPAEFMQAVERCREYIKAGDMMQVVLSHRQVRDFHAGALALYRALRGVNPSPYMFYLHMGELEVVGSSPEILVRQEDGNITVRPLAGTRKRGSSEAEDERISAELLQDPKELAEHLMLMDLGRNDVGRVAKNGSVRLTEQMQIEKYSHVLHIVSNVEAQVAAGVSAMDVFRATFPAGTVSGAPKIRAMEIIDELEPLKRGIYSGAVGYLGWHGNLDTAIALRTAVVKNQKLYMQSGAGIVYDSVPEEEWQEVLNKARAIMQAAEIAEEGL